MGKIVVLVLYPQIGLVFSNLISTMYLIKLSPCLFLNFRLVLEEQNMFCTQQTNCWS